MTKYHFNPATGEPGACRAEVACPFGLPLDGHFHSLREAAVAAEEKLLETAGGSFGPTGMVQSFEEWSAQREAQAKLTERRKSPTVNVTTPTAPVEQYVALMPTNLSHLGSYARNAGLDLQEAWHFAGVLHESPKVTPNEYRHLLLEGVKRYVAEATEKTDTLDTTLNESKYFGGARFRQRSSGLTLETYSTQDGSDLITRIDDKGKASFEVFDHEDGESSYSTNVDGWQSSIGDWMPQFKAYQDHLYLRVLWEAEKKRRNDRYEAIARRV